jgi:hypothetical protein
MLGRTVLPPLFAALLVLPARGQMPPPLPPEAAAAPQVVAGPANLVIFDPAQAELRWQDNRWQLFAGDVPLKDFGRYEADGRAALRVVRELQLTEYGTVGRPRPVIEYWLSHGLPPQGPASGLRTIAIDQATLKLEQAQGQWWVRDANRPLFSFDTHEDDAHEALGVLKRYGFNQVGYIGQVQTSMLVFLASAGGLSRARLDAPPSLAVPRVAGVQTSRHMPASANTPGAAAQAGALAPAALPHGRQLITPDAPLPGQPVVADRVPINWRQAQLRRDAQGWVLVVGNYTLAAFGPEEGEARQGLKLLQDCRVTEHCVIGNPVPAFSYFLANGQAPRGLPVGAGGVPFQPDKLALRQAEHGWTIVADGGRALLQFGDRAQEALQTLQAIQQYKFDHLVRLSHIEPGPTLLLRTR